MRPIDADKFLSQLEDQYMEHDITREEYIDLEDRIMQQPTIDPVKHGRWEKLDLWTKPVCSVCGEPCFGLHGFSYETTTYCPNCGARMEGEEE